MDNKYIKLDKDKTEKIKKLPNLENLKPVELLPHCSLFSNQTCEGRLGEKCGYRCVYYDDCGNIILR